MRGLKLYILKQAISQSNAGKSEMFSIAQLSVIIGIKENMMKLENLGNNCKFTKIDDDDQEDFRHHGGEAYINLMNKRLITHSLLSRVH